ncbi:hypothetical protein SDC9_176399 [bioreactor metagenome]|uniref:Uncharacterized protein n=1 Tax=bioreactor metagenome TaxID=1076179 RepID=A0A645GZA4_9ZZZZ
MNNHDRIVIVDIQHQIFQRTGGCRHAQFRRKAVHHFHFRIAGTHGAKFGQHA